MREGTEFTGLVMREAISAPVRARTTCSVPADPPEPPNPNVLDGS
eukprot:CAMPEP_0197568660 /NCGR_PEP_ID=MMETSP1320-20131121/37694_1 /TAXON_ID=91990 /ORGANISM="Bolidomonas sp., Strain RCC2347" /LENGTH=44 /DNA_ID= /DNA_START= /DNA_END= /DNA_ORIENTATION=